MVVDVQKLLPDVLVLIFSHAFAINIINANAHRLCKREMAETIVRVCRHWREVALSCPLLWRDLRVAGLSRRNSAMFKGYLARTKEVPVNISLKLGPPARSTRGYKDFVDEQAILYEQVWGAMVDQQHRWESVLTFCSHIIDRTERTWHLDNLPNLESIILETPMKQNQHHDSPVICLDLSKSPRIRRLSLYGDIALRPIGRNLLDRLTRLRLDHSISDQRFPSISDCLVILSAAPNIEQIHIVPARFLHPSERSLPKLPHLVLPKLFRLEAGTHGKRALIGRLLAQLTLPSLRQLCITNDAVRISLSDEIHESSIHDYGLPELLQRSHPPLEKFHIYSIIEQEEQLINFLRYMPHLRELRLSYCSTLSKNLFHSLSFANSVESTLCPVLELIDLQACNFQRLGHRGAQSEEVIEAAVGLITSRWIQPTRKRSLARVEFLACCLSELQDKPIIKECVAEGLKLVCMDR